MAHLCYKICRQSGLLWSQITKFMGPPWGPPSWVLSAPDGPHVGPMNLAIRVVVTVHDTDENMWGTHRLVLIADVPSYQGLVGRLSDQWFTDGQVPGWVNHSILMITSSWHHTQVAANTQWLIQVRCLTNWSINAVSIKRCCIEILIMKMVS